MKIKTVPLLVVSVGSVLVGSYIVGGEIGFGAALIVAGAFGFVFSPIISDF